MTTAVIVSGLLATSACSQFRIRTDYDRTADFQALRTYAWRAEPPLPSGDPRIDNAWIDTRVRAAVDRVLAAKGFAPAGSRDPDFLVGYHAVVRSKTSAATINRRYGYLGVGFAYADVNSYEEGTLVIDVVERETMKLLWRGSATGVVLEKPGPEKRERRINEAVGGILEKFPPGR
jgi:hypothetical protein